MKRQYITFLIILSATACYSQARLSASYIERNDSVFTLIEVGLCGQDVFDMSPTECEPWEDGCIEVDTFLFTRINWDYLLMFVSGIASNESMKTDCPGGQSGCFIANDLVGTTFRSSVDSSLMFNCEYNYHEVYIPPPYKSYNIHYCGDWLYYSQDTIINVSVLNSCISSFGLKAYDGPLATGDHTNLVTGAAIWVKNLGNYIQVSEPFQDSG